MYAVKQLEEYLLKDLCNIVNEYLMPRASKANYYINVVHQFKTLLPSHYMTVMGERRPYFCAHCYKNIMVNEKSGSAYIGNVNGMYYCVYCCKLLLHEMSHYGDISNSCRFDNNELHLLRDQIRRHLIKQEIIECSFKVQLKRFKYIRPKNITLIKDVIKENVGIGKSIRNKKRRYNKSLLYNH